jgi:sulfur carrier protein ThiS
VLVARDTEHAMLVTARLRPPGNTVEVADAKRVDELLERLDILPSTVLVIRGTELLTAADELADGDQVEIRYAISGGAA